MHEDRLYIMSIQNNLLIGTLKDNNHIVLYGDIQSSVIKEPVLQYSKHEGISDPQFHSFSKLIQNNILDHKTNFILIKSSFGDLLYISGKIQENIDLGQTDLEPIKYLVLDHVSGELEALLNHTTHLKRVITYKNFDKGINDLVQKGKNKNVQYSFLKYRDYISLETTSYSR